MIKCLQLTNKLFRAIIDNKWDDANDICEQLSIVLSTYKKGC